MNYFGVHAFYLTKQVVGIMRVNVERVLERDQKLSELDDRAGEGLGCWLVCLPNICASHVLS